MNTTNMEQVTIRQMAKEKVKIFSKHNFDYDIEELELDANTKVKIYTFDDKTTWIEYHLFDIMDHIYKIIYKLSKNNTKFLVMMGWMNLDQYIITILKNEDLFDEITLFTDDPIDAFKRMFDTYLEYNLTLKGNYTIILSLYVENGKNKVLSKLTNRNKRRKRIWKRKLET